MKYVILDKSGQQVNLIEVSSKEAAKANTPKGGKAVKLPDDIPLNVFGRNYLADLWSSTPVGYLPDGTKFEDATEEQIEYWNKQ